LVSQKTTTYVTSDAQDDGTVILKIMLDQMFCLTTDMVQALQDFLEHFRAKDLAHVPGENVVVITKQLLVVSTRLAEVNKLPTKTVKCVLQGFALSSVDKFKEPFELMLMQKQIDDMNKVVGLKLSSDLTLACIKTICIKATTTYESLSLSNEWNIPLGTALSCWNCGSEKHRADKCNQPRDNKEFGKNKRQ